MVGRGTLRVCRYAVEARDAARLRLNGLVMGLVGGWGDLSMLAG